MQDTVLSVRPPVTQLRPLHTRTELDASLSAQLSWTSSLGFQPSKDAVLQAFVRLVSHIIIADQGEAFCIQDTAHDGYIEAHTGDGQQNSPSYSFVHYGKDKGIIPTDFSIGPGKALQLHVEDGQVRLVAQASTVPQSGLDALGQALQDIIRDLDKGSGKAAIQWTQPSVLNFPPQERPMPLWPSESLSTSALLHSRFEQRARDHPQRVALDFLENLETAKRVQYTYQQVSNAATALATKLYHVGSMCSTAPKTVAVAMGPCPELYVSYLASLKAGLAFCPIPIDAPAERQDALLADLQPVAVLAVGPGGLKTTLESINVTPFLEACDVEPAHSPPVTVSETDAAYVLYTSGTTGLPKGVVVSHISAACTISALSQCYGFCPDDTSASVRPVRWFQGAAPTFDISLFEIFWTLSTGSTLCCAPRHLTMQNVDQVVTALEADITNVTPSFASLIDPSLLRGLMVGGEPLNTRLLQDFARHNPSARDVLSAVPQGIYNGYGPTEVTIYSLAQPHVPANQRGSVIGKPLATCGVLIVGEQTQSLEPVPMGTTGELILTGPQVSRRGYLNRPDETAKAFVDDARWGRAYRTGDRARIVWSEQGEPVVEFLGRMSDAQVKLSGRRVELGEIESVLASKVQGVQQTLACVWKPQDGTSGSEKVVSLVVVDAKSGLDFEAVQAQCVEVAQHHLPDYMRPFRILRVESLPRSASGKVNRKEASAYVRQVLQQVIHEESPRKAEVLGNAEDAKLEDELVKILSILVGNGPDDTQSSLTATRRLTEAGVDSLRAMRLLREIRSRWPGSKHLQPSLGLLLDPEASIRSVFFPSVSAVDKKANAQQRMADFASRHMAACLEKLGSISQADVEMVLPATSTQSQLAVSFAMDRRNYISHTVLPLKANISAEALEKAVHAVLDRHAIYRCALVPCSDDLAPFAQIVLKPQAWHRWTDSHPRVVRRQGIPASKTQTWLDLAQQNLDFDSQQMYCVQIVEPKDAEDDGLLVISVAHCLCDGASLEVLLSDISREIAGLDPLPRLSVYDAVLDWVSGLDAETDRHWQESLRGWEAESFHALSGSNTKSSSSSSPSTSDHGHAMVEFSSDVPWKRLEAKSRDLGASPLAVLQAAWSLLLKIFSEANTEDIVFGSVLSGQHEAAHTPTFSVVPCRVPLPERQTVRELLALLVDGSRFAQGHRSMSFGLFESLPYNTALALQAYAPPEANEASVADTPWTAAHNPAIRYDFDLFSEVLPGRQAQDTMLFKLTYRDDVLSETSAQVIVRQFSALTEALLDAQTDNLVQSLPARLPRKLLSIEGTPPVPTEDPVEKQRQARERVEVLHAQFENQAEETPDRLALSFYAALNAPPVDLTYAELDARANGLANILREEDAEVIPICMQRCVELYVSVLAILKAGSAWSPIDETSPVQRRTSLIARTQGKVLLTTTDSLSLVEPCLAHESLAGVRVILVDQYDHLKTSVRAKPRRGVLAAASQAAITGQDLAYLLWTSGTTGEPKGVMIQHYAAANAMRDLQVRVEHDKDAGQVRTLQLSAYSFDVFVQDLFYTWGLAGSVISGTRELVLGSFTEFVNQSRPTHAHLTPSFGASINVEEIVGSTLRYVTFIGEKLTEDVAEAWAAPQVTTKAYNTYGPAENAVVSTMRQFLGKSRDAAKAANVGFPLTPCTAYVVREVASAAEDAQAQQWELVPRYGVGELALGGAQVAKGYLNNVAKTTKAFIQGGPGIDERIYLTGDMVRLNDHGFEFLGRNDDLVKITGIRIELSEISAACALVKDQEPAVEHVETLYLPRPGAGGGDARHKVIVSFVSVKPASGTIETGSIRKQVFQKAREVLPAYMVPGHVVVLETTMPRTASNKVDRKALQAIYSSADLSVLAGRDPSTASNGVGAKSKWPADQLPVVEAIASNLAVPLDPLDPNDSLAGLGFSSLQVTKLAWSLRRQMACEVGVLDLMRCQTLGELVAVVQGSMKKTEPAVNDESAITAESAVVNASRVSSLQDTLTKSLHGAVRPRNTSYIVPATPVQESLLVETMIEPGAYWSHRLFDLSPLGQVDALRLKAAWTAAAAHLDILRTVFAPLSQFSVREEGAREASTGQWARSQGVHATLLQLILDTPVIRWTILDIEEATADSLASLARKTQVELSPLGASPSPPWAVAFAPSTNTMMLSMHHSLHDGESSRMLLDIVARFYRNPESSSDAAISTALPLARGMDLGLLPSIAQRDEACAAWTEHLHRLVEADGALNAPFPDLTGSRQRQERTILSAKTAIPSEFLKQTPAGGPDLPRLVQSAFGCVLAAVLELKTIVLGQTVSQRILHPDLSRVVGPAMATLPVAVRTCAPSSQALWLEMGRDALSLGARAHNLHPVDIKKMINEGSGDANAPFPALFVYHPAGEDDAGPEAFREVGQALSLNVEHPMALNVFEADRIIELTGDARRISQPMLDLMLAQIISQARVMLDHPDMPLAKLSNYMSRELTSSVGDCTTLVGQKIARSPAELVTNQAAKHPDWVAIEEIFMDDEAEGDDHITTTTVTYGELEVLVNAIASQITSLAAGNLAPDDVVALYLERDTKSLAAIPAIFKCGYVYLPIDGELPAARKQLLVRDANAKLVVTTERLVGDLNLDDGILVVFLPECDNEIDVIRSWPNTFSQGPPQGQGGYLLYTSGSTGRPKGVRVTNENLMHFIAAMTQRLTEANPEMATLGGVGKFLNVASRAFDTHLTSMFAPWHLGFRSAIGKDRSGIFASLPQVINEVQITNMGTVPSVLLQLGLQLTDVPSIRVLTFGGEKASHELFEQLNADDPGTAALMNFYGPTEAAIGCLSHAIGHHSNARNLGLPLPGLEALILVPGDGDEQVVARRGQPGEFCIAGPQVAVGYLNRPEENARSFQHTTLLGGTKRMYRTGDIMRMMHDGTVEFLGRRDQQTKIRGQRFEIGEVEAFIKKVVANEGPLDVAAAVVDQRLVGLLARRLNTLLKAEREAEPELLSPPSRALQAVLETVEQACQQGLPNFMVPDMMWVSKIPYLAASGKLDTKRIIQLVTDAANQEHAPHRTDSAASPAVSLSRPEQEVISALQEVFGSTVTATASSSVRKLGVDSLSGVNLLSALKRRGFSKVAFADLLSPSCSVASLAQMVDSNFTFDEDSRVTAPVLPSANLPVKELSLEDLGSSANGLGGAKISAILSCLPLQSSLVALSLNWLDSDEETTDSDDVPYVTQFNYQLAHGTDVALWKKAAEQVVSSEATLRTCFVQREQDGRIFQVVLESPPSPFDGQDDAATLVSQMSIRPPIRLRVQDDRVSFKIHHALYDGAAMATLRKKIEQAYANGAVASDSQSLSTLRHLAQHCDLADEEMQAVKTAWQAKLRGITPCRVDRHPDKDSKSATARSTRRLAYTAAELKAKLQRTDGGGSVSASTAFQLATVLCLAYLTRSPSIVYGFTMSLRPLLGHIAEDVDGFVGPCLNTIVHATALKDAGETLSHLAARVDQDHAGACQGNMPLVTADKIQRWAGLEEKLFDSLLTINVAGDAHEKSAPGCMRPLPGKAKIDLALTIDIDLHANGRIDVMLGSSGVLTEAQLSDVGIFFEKVVAESASSTATVAQFASLGYSNGTTNGTNGIAKQPKSRPSDEGIDTALACVRSAACRLLRLDEAIISAQNPESTSLYRLGLDSINVSLFVKLINKSEGIKIAPNAVIRARTLQGVAALVHEAKIKAESRRDTPPFRDAPNGLANGKPADGQATYDQTLQQLAGDLLFVATPLQEGMLSASMALADQAYTYTHTMQLSEQAYAQDSPSFGRFFAAVKDTVQACEILRSRFIFTDNGNAPWVGVVSPTEQSDLVYWNISEAGVVQLRIHHALYDAGSIQALWQLLNQNYANRLLGRQGGRELYPYRHFARLSAMAQKSAIEFWTSAVQDYTYAPATFLDDSLHASSAFYFSLSDTELASLQAICREASVTPKAALQLAWAKVLCETLYKQVDIVFGEVITASGDDYDDRVVMGPTINTIPLRIKLANSPGAASIGEALSRLQTLGDQARGPNGMASLRAIQTAWRSSRADGVNTAAGLFQSLFVFDGVVSSERDASANDPIVLARANSKGSDKGGEKSPAYDDYPLIVSFRIRDGVLHGALRAKVDTDEVNRLGAQLEAALRYVASGNLKNTALNPAHVHLADTLKEKRVRKEANGHSSGDTNGAELNGLTEKADAVLQIAKKAVGTRARGNIDYTTKLINVGLDSILAIRFSNMLKKHLGIHASVFEIMRGASVQDIVKKWTAAEKTNGVKQKRQQQQPSVSQDGLLKSLAADKLRLTPEKIKSVSPVLPGQRDTLQKWLHSGKRFFEAPWVYRIADASIDANKVAGYWAELCRAHEILQTTFAALGHSSGSSPDLVQVTLHESVTAASRFTAVRDETVSILELVQKHVREGNTTPSDLKDPPARLSFLEASDGKAVVLRVHHALYDSWSIKMIQKDLVSLFTSNALQPHPSVQSAIQEIARFRRPEAEQAYWKQHLAEAQDTIIQSDAVTANRSNKAPLGPHFKAAYADILPQNIVDTLASATHSKSDTSVGIIVAYARALGQLTGCTRPTFGFNYSSRSLSSADGEQTLDLTDMSVPTMSIIPLSVNLETQSEQPLDVVREHLAQLTKFAQADNLHKLSPKYNTHINILYAGENVEAPSGRAENEAQVLQRHKLGEPLASEYFTKTRPSTITSTVDSLDTSVLHRQQFYFNVLVRQDGNMSVDMSGDEDLLRCEQDFVSKFVEHFGAELVKVFGDN